VSAPATRDASFAWEFLRLTIGFLIVPLRGSYRWTAPSVNRTSTKQYAQGDFSFFRSLMTMYLDRAIQPQRNQRIWLSCAVVIALCALL
jgi:hypothetical protein